MPNDLTGNPIYIDAAANSAFTGPKRVQLIQWVDDAADIADGDSLVYVVNGKTTTIVQQIPTDVGMIGPIFYEARFPLGLMVHSFSVTTIDHGALHIWTV